MKVCESKSTVGTDNVISCVIPFIIYSINEDPNNNITEQEHGVLLILSLVINLIW